MATLEADVTKAPPYLEASQTLSDGDHMDLIPGNGLDCLEIHNITHGADCDVVKMVDSTGDGTFDRSVTIDSLTGSGLSQGNQIELGSKNVKLRVTDTSGGSDNDYILTGVLLR